MNHRAHDVTRFKSKHVIYRILSKSYKFVLLITQVHFYSTRIRYMFNFLHQNMHDIFQNSIKKDTTTGDWQITLTPMDTKFFLKNQDNLCDCIDMISEAFGFQISLIAVCLIVFILHVLNIELKVIFGMQTYSSIMELSILAVVHVVQFLVSNYLYERISPFLNQCFILQTA